MAQRTKLDSLDIPISDSWRRLIVFAKNEVPHGELSIKVVNGEAVEVISFKRKIRLDRADALGAMSNTGPDVG